MSKGGVLITGAAGGIGTATVDRFLASGYEVMGIDLSPAVETLRPQSYRGMVADVTKPEELVGAIDELLHDLQLRHVVGLAGAVVTAEKDILEREAAAAAEAFAESISLNLTGQFSLVHAALPRLERADGDRSITLCSSVNALRGFGAPAYSGAKAGLIGMMHALAEPLGRLGIRINVVAPGTTRTPLRLAEAAETGDPMALERSAQEIPLGRIGEPDDVGAAIESVADRLTFVTDEVIRVDGGQALARPADRRPVRLVDRVRSRVTSGMRRRRP